MCSFKHKKLFGTKVSWHSSKEQTCPLSGIRWHFERTRMWSVWKKKTSCDIKKLSWCIFNWLQCDSPAGAIVGSTKSSSVLLLLPLIMIMMMNILQINCMTVHKLAHKDDWMSNSVFDHQFGLWNLPDTKGFFFLEKTFQSRNLKL